MDTKGMRKELNMTAKEFADKFKIPYATVRNWDARYCMPEYLYNLLWYRIRVEKALSETEIALKNHDDNQLTYAICHTIGINDYWKDPKAL